MRGGSLFLVLALALGAVAVPLLSAAADEVVPWTLVLVLAALMVGALAAERAREGFFDVFSPLALAVWATAEVALVPAVLRLVLPPGAVTANGIPYVTPELFAEALLLSIIGFMAMYAGYVVGVGRRLGAMVPVPPADWHHGRAVVVAGAYALIGVAAYATLLASFGGMSGFLAVRARSAYVQDDSLFLFAGVVVMRVGVLVALTAWIFRRDAKRPSVGVIAFVVLVLALTLMLRGRGRVLSILVMALFMYHFGRRRIRFRQFAMLVVGAVGSLLLLDQAFAYMGGYELKSGAGLVRELGGSKKLDKLGSFLLVLRGIPAELDFQWGSTIVAVPFDFVPDRWFPDHPEGAAHVFTRTFFPSAYQAGVGVPPSLWTELYMNFGAVGIAVGSFLLGLWLDALRHLGRVVRSHPGLLLVFVTLLYYTVSLQTTVLETSIPHMMMDVGPAAAAALFVTRFRLHRQQRPGAAPTGLGRPARPLTGTAG
ncbi:MAG: hypothetical protein AVDCRST_MAG89-415 [uncultured Gemmatimonadetes bacterium]|uniref:Uncharacterized protein n=1 Tax=uncultured Gemmatimonadota bacterium TaxID=203437 RepID=A0A6J4KB89_9BACT|nr:MAG: hypothetical protein AVDCRST_MAG89-415 [uncultured Gemmatimonadota bacterium]